MKRFIKSLTLVTLLLTFTVQVWGQASPSTEGRDFWVTFLRAADDDPTELKLTISALEACDVTIENTQNGFNRRLHVNDNAALELVMDQANCYSSTSETPTYTALHVTATKDISLFAGNYRDKSFDATNVLPTAALLDDYLIQTYPPSDHEDKPQGSHFAIIAVEDGQTTVDMNLTARTNGGKTGAQSVTLNKGQVYYVWTGKNSGNEADLSGTTVKARNGKKIAIFQGCPHTNIPDHVRDRDHIVSQAMPLAYWGSEFGITASRHHRRDIIAVMAINDGTQVYINNEDGDKILVHTFDFTKDKKHYWTFELGEELAYCADNAGQSPSHGKLPEPLVIDSSCYLSTSCPAGVHLFMVSNRYDNLTEKVNSDTLVSDPAMLWVSPIEQVIKEINFATYHTKQAKFHYMNILTTTADVSNMTWNGNSIASHFHPLMGNSDYSFARIEIPEGNHHLKGSVGFLAHVYGYGERESYAYSCGSSTIQRSVTFNGSPLMIDSTYHGKFCVNEDIEMKLNIGNNDYESILWDYGDGITYVAPTNISNDEKKKTSHTYTVPGWYDLKVTAVYINQCTGTKHNEEMRFSFRVVRADTILVAPKDSCISLADQAQIIADHGQAYLDSLVANGGRTILNPDAPCYEDKQLSFVKFDLETETVLDSTVRDGVDINGTWYDASTTVTWTVSQPHKCDQHFTCNLTVITCLEMNVTNNPEAQHVCPPQSLAVAYTKTKGSIKSARFVVEGILDKEVTFSDANTQMGTIELPTESLRKPGVYHGKLIVEDLYCGDIFTYPIDFMVYYPSDIFRYKFNNVLAVYNSGFGGNTGYTFKAYQWYLNYQAIEGATEPVLYLGDGVTFAIGDVVYVALTDMNDVTIPSCPQTIKDVPDYTAPETNNAPARKMLINGQFVIEKGDGTYDIYGQKVQ